MKVKINLLICAVILSIQVFPQEFLRGNVIDLKTGNPIPYVNINIPSVNGTATNENGDFLLKVGKINQDDRVIFSCIGYSSISYLLDSLIKNNGALMQVALEPISLLLKEITIEDERFLPKRIVEDAINEISTNYIQRPFNMEFYSMVSVKDSLDTYFLVESIVEAYRTGYIEGAENYTKMIHKRTTGESPLKPAFDSKRKVHFFPHEKLPTHDIFLVDAVGMGRRYNYTIFNPDYFEKLSFEKLGITIFENDTVLIIEYSPIQKTRRSINNTGGGILFISAKDLAIIKHTRYIEKIYLEVVYRKWGNYYFPYFIKTIYPSMEKGSHHNVVHESIILKVKTENLKVFEKFNDWHLDDIPFDQQFWNLNFPTK